MLDMNFVRENPDAVKEALAKRHSKIDLDAFLELDKQRREVILSVEKLKSQRNSASQEIGRMKKAGENADAQMAAVRALGEEIAAGDAKLKDIDRMENDGTMAALPKKEQANIRKEFVKLDKNLGGIQHMPKFPGAIIVVDVKNEALAITEANKLGIPVIAMVDTNVDPDGIDYIIPANDDAIRSISLITSVLANAVIEGRQGLGNEEVVATEEVVAE